VNINHPEPLKAGAKDDLVEMLQQIGFHSSTLAVSRAEFLALARR